ARHPNRNVFHDVGEPEAVTDSNGNYTFVNAPAGSYQVVEEPQAGWTQSSPTGAFATPKPGPDGFGYGAYAAPFQYAELVNDPAALTSLRAGDDTSGTVNLGTNSFNFYGTSYTGNNKLVVSANGFVSFATSDTSFN